MGSDPSGRQVVRSSVDAGGVIANRKWKIAKQVAESSGTGTSNFELRTRGAVADGATYRRVAGGRRDELLLGVINRYLPLELLLAVTGTVCLKPATCKGAMPSLMATFESLFRCQRAAVSGPVGSGRGKGVC